jgi:signal transduction histidine kinase
MTKQTDKWSLGNARGNFYEYQKTTGWNDFELIAFAPVQIGDELMIVGVKTPDEVARQTSLTNFQGQQRIFIISVITIFSGVLFGGLVLRREIRRRFQAEEALKRRDMEQAIATERNRLAGDLHDSVTQGLYGIVLHADAAKGQLASNNRDRALDYLDEIKSAGKDALAEMRLLIFELRPPVLEREGLAAALETRLYAVEQRAGLKADFKAELHSNLPPEIEEGCYRIAQEALNNTLKHAEAQHVRVQLSQTEQIVKLEICDDGKGFEPVSAQNQGGMGLSNMYNRAKQLGGQLSIQSSPGEGTQIVL